MISKCCAALRCYSRGDGEKLATFHFLVNTETRVRLHHVCYRAAVPLTDARRSIERAELDALHERKRRYGGGISQGAAREALQATVARHNTLQESDIKVLHDTAHLQRASISAAISRGRQPYSYRSKVAADSRTLFSPSPPQEP